MPTISRRRTTAALAAVSTGLLAVLSACSATPTSAAPPAPITIAPVPATATATDGATSAPRPAPTTTRGNRPQPGTTTRPPGQPARTTSTVYAQLVDVWHTGPSSYALVYDRVDYLTGKAAAAYYRAHPEKEPLDWAISNPDSTLDQLPVAASGAFYGNQLLGPGNGSTTARITGDQLIDRLTAHPRTLVAVTERPAGNHPEVVKVAEVYVP